jgi:vacuolar-type H+-ATPase subunit F/Vma7
MNRKYFELVVEGQFDLVKGFVLGFLEGKGIRQSAMFAREHHVKGDRELKHVLRVLTGKQDQARVLVDENVCQSLGESLANVREALPLRLVSTREISGAHAGFTYEAYAKEMGDELKALFVNPPEGVAVADYESEEKVEPEGKGIEAYAPLHHYEIKAKGRITGAVGPLIDFYDKLEQNPLVALEEIVLEFR